MIVRSLKEPEPINWDLVDFRTNRVPEKRSPIDIMFIAGLIVGLFFGALIMFLFF